MIDEFHYRIPWRSQRAHPGHHRSAQSGGDDEFLGHAPLLSESDPRRLDVHATLQDPFGQLMVRVFRQRSAIPVWVLADLSASMAFGNPAGKLAALARFTASVAYSAYRTGDPFGFLGGDDRLRMELAWPLRWHKGIAADLHRRLLGFRPDGRSADGLREAGPLLGRHRTLVFLVSDFHMPRSSRQELFQSLIRHDVVPVVIRHPNELEGLPRRGWITLRDAETGAKRRLFMRPGLHGWLKRHFEEQQAELTDECLRYGRPPFFIHDRFTPEELTEYFLNQ